MFLISIFTTYIYQPFLNILVFFYWVDGLISHGHPDMGIAVILLTIVIRILLLPLSLMEDKSEADRHAMILKLHEIETVFAADPLALREETRKLFHRNRGVVIGEMVSFFVQAGIALILWKIFSTGLEGQDLPLIYSFMPKVVLPFNLLFLGKYDLGHTNLTLNIMQSVMIFLVETASILTSPYPPMKGEVVRLQLVLPVVSFLVFMFLPAGKKVFIITTLLISLLILIYKFLRRRITAMFPAPVDESLAAAAAAAPAASQPPALPGQPGVSQPTPSTTTSPMQSPPVSHPSNVTSSHISTSNVSQVLERQPRPQYQERILEQIK